MTSLKFAAIALLACLFVAAAFAQGQQRRPGGGGGSVGDEAYGDLSEFQTFKKEDFKGIEEAVDSFLHFGEESREVDRKGGYHHDKGDGLKTLELDFSFNLFALIKK